MQRLNSLASRDLDRLIGEAPDALLQCSVEPKHRVKACRLKSHTAGCLRASVHLGFRQCPFAHWHVVRSKAELEAHVLVCPDRSGAATATAADADAVNAEIAVLLSQTACSDT